MTERDPNKAPLVEALLRYRQRRRASFHVPGHKAGSGYNRDPGVASWLGAVGVYDATELPELDDLHDPSGVIEQAQALAADCFGAERSYFLVGGSTVGNLASIYAASGAGELLIMQRNVHKSAIHALMLSGSGAVFATPERDPDSGIYTGLNAAAVKQALDKHPEAKAVFLTNPNYYGMTVDVASIAAEVHARGKPLIVDEAHGAHFGIHPKFPRSALQCGADVVIQSTHKMLPAMTMGAMLHVQGNRIETGRIERYLRMLQSSSPSYPIMASLDWARREVHTRGSGMFDEALQAVQRLMAVNTENQGEGRFIVTATDDPMKPLLHDRYGEITGYQLQEQLAELGIYLEMADEQYTVCACSSATSVTDAERLVQALSELNLRFPVKKKEILQNFSNTNELWSLRLSEPVYFREGGADAWALANEPYEISIDEAAGALSAEMIIPYPPGIPLLYPGEMIAPEAVQALKQLRNQGAAVQGALDRSLRTIRVWRNRFDL